jgi:hypothetical protein
MSGIPPEIAVTPTRKIEVLVMIDKIIEAMVKEVERLGLQLLAGSYANDLLVADRMWLEMHVVAGLQAAWVVGDSHTHLTTLGLHPKHNEMVPCLTRLSSSDRYFLLSIGNESFTLKEVNREQFLDKGSYKIHYSEKQTSLEQHTVFHQNKEVGVYRVAKHGYFEEASYEVGIACVEGATPLERLAVELHANHKVCQLAGSLWAKVESKTFGMDYVARSKAA